MHPYRSLSPKAFWKSGVGNRSAFEFEGLWEPKFPISKADKITTYGSCFAQHIGKSLDDRGFNWFRSEPSIFGMSSQNQKKFGYNLFSSRTGNIYTTSQLLQWTNWAVDPAQMPEGCWEISGRFFDPIRHAIEPDGFVSKEELLDARETTCLAFKQSVKESNIFIFTLGLTERWLNTTGGFEFPVCPPARVFNKEDHIFSNMSYQDVEMSLRHAILNLKEMNHDIKIVLTVSPVPMVATASGNHVLVANMHSKSLLRCAAAQAALECDSVDYFPSYEIINSPHSRGVFFEPNLRSVNSVGVSLVMDIFFSTQNEKFGNSADFNLSKGHLDSFHQQQSVINDLVCEEELLFAFGADL